MGFTALERMLATQRFRQRMGRVDFSTPSYLELRVNPESGPFISTNMRGKFIPTRCSKDAVVIQGFSPCTVEEEPALLLELHQTVTRASSAQKWRNRCSTLTQALDRMRSFGLKPWSVVIPESLLREVCGPERDLEGARKSMQLRGHVAVVDGIQVLLSSLPDRTAIVAAEPSRVGFYTRVGNYLGILLQEANRSLVVVGDGNEFV